MAKVSVRRYGDPVFIRALKDGISKISAQKQCPNEERIVRVVQQEFEWTKGEILKQLKQAVKDGSFVQVTAISSHGSTKGIPQTAYRIPQSEVKPDKAKNIETHDWYCWECHMPGEVILCDHCPRVFHRRCAHDGTVTGSKWKCPSCQPPKVPALMASKSLDELAKMLTFTLERMKEKAKDFLKPFDLNEYEDYLEFIFKPVDLSLLEKRVGKKQYKTAKEFREEAQWILHNAIIYFGDDTEMTDLAEAIMEDCDGELEEMIRCPDCYIMSNVRSQNWFCKPCYFPHDLVWAKMTGEPPWPAKLLAWNDDQSRALVRFFGSAHQRAWVGNRYVTPITTKPDVKKRSQRWIQAIEEMDKYQQQLRQLYPENKQQKEKPTLKNRTAVANKETQTESNVDESYRKRNTNEQESNEKITELEKMTEKARKSAEEESRKKDEHIKKLEMQEKVLEENLKSATVSLECERERSKQLVEQLQMKETNEILKNCRTNSQISQKMEIHIGGQQNNNRNSYDTIIKEQTGIIKQLQISIEREKQERRELIDQVTQESQKTRERELQHAVKRAVNKERLERERAIEETVKKTVEKTKLEKERQIQKALQIAKEEAEKSLQEAVALAKRKQWCAYCCNEAFYPCCWNTSYCTVECQKAHWCTHRFHCMRLACNCGRECGKTC